MRAYSILLGSLLLPALLATASAQTYDQGPVFSLLEENDLLVKTDRHYTQGTKLSYLQADGHVPRCVSNLFQHVPAILFTEKRSKFGYEIGQSIYTPADLSKTALIPNDRPYAGWLYTGLILHRRGVSKRDIPVLESFQMDLGIIGPDALSGESQTWVHEIRSFGLPRGWRNQLKDEPGIALRSQRSYLLSLKWGEMRWLDFIPHGGASLGNVDTSVRGGALLRLGWDLPHDFGPKIIDSLMVNEGGHSPTSKTGRWSLYVFGGVEGRILGFNEFLDGNLYHRSQHVKKEQMATDFQGGAVLVLNRFEVGFTTVYRTKDFLLQSKRDAFGSFVLKYKF